LEVEELSAVPTQGESRFPVCPYISLSSEWKTGGFFGWFGFYIASPRSFYGTWKKL